MIKTTIQTTNIKKAIAAAVTLIMLVSSIAPLFTVFAKGDAFTVYDEKDYLKLVKLCKTDTNSADLVVELKNDIDVSKIKFAPIPTFSGTFNGNGYTVDGVNITSKGSYKGLFRYIEKGATVRDLNVRGKVYPDGSKEYVGGIVGQNSGTLINCTFSGEVSAETNVGGICGYITETGVADGCTFDGSVQGKSYAGGIAGQNYGTIKNCSNSGSINTVNTEGSKSLQDLNIDVENLRSTENINTATDTGGICGYNKGNIMSCTNSGSIGYKSVGYNTGGICGRTAGYISDCTNTGSVRGRKDVGGICGQAEPYVLLEFSEDVLSEMQSVLADIRRIVNNEIDSDNDDITNILDNINSNVSDASDNINSMSKDIKNYANNVTDDVNDLSARMQKMLKDSDAVFTGLTQGIDTLATGIGSLADAGRYLQKSMQQLNNSLTESDLTDDDINKMGQYLTNANEKLMRALNDLDTAVSSLNRGAKQLQTAIKKLEQALKNKKDIEESFRELWDTITGISSSLLNAAGSVQDAASVIEGLNDNGLSKDDLTKLVQNLRDLAKCYRDIAGALSGVSDALLVMAEDFDVYAFRSSVRLFKSAFTNIQSVFEILEKKNLNLGASLEDLRNASENGVKAIKEMNEGIKSMKSACTTIGNATADLNRIIQEFADGESFSVPKISDSFSSKADSLFDTVDAIQNEFSKLNNSIKDTKNRFKGDISEVLGEFETLAAIFKESYNDAVDPDSGDIIEDISDSDTPGSTRGKVNASVNRGKVSGDVNIGGICGSMAVEYDFDPEDDVKKEGSRSAKFVYKTKCVLRKCTNEGNVTSKKDYSGGICGRMSLGTVTLCDNYGTVKGTDGDYVGGIAGKSESGVYNSAAKCRVSGNSYVGGIVGEGDKIQNCMSLVTISKYDEFAGTIAGKANRDNVSGNFFVNDDLGAIDDINYSTIAEQTDIGGFVDFVKMTFGKDIVFTLRFVADGKEIATLNFNYKDKIPEDKIPTVPKKNGYFGKWSNYDFNDARYDATLKATYHRNMDIISTAQKRDDGKSVVIVCGAFDDSARVTAEKLNNSPKKRTIDANKVKISGTHSATYTIRYLPKSDNDNYKIYVDTGKGFKKTDIKKKGSYVEFETDSKNFTLLEVKKNYAVMIILIAIAVSGMAAAVLAMVSGKRKLKAA